MSFAFLIACIVNSYHSRFIIQHVGKRLRLLEISERKSSNFVIGSFPTQLMPNDVERQGESAPLLSPPERSRRRKVKRRASESSVVLDERSTRWWTAILGSLVLLIILSIGGGVWASRNEHKGDDVPDFTKLPGPQPGLRNPSYLCVFHNVELARSRLTTPLIQV